MPVSTEDARIQQFCVHTDFSLISSRSQGAFQCGISITSLMKKAVKKKSGLPQYLATVTPFLIPKGAPRRVHQRSSDLLSAPGRAKKRSRGHNQHESPRAPAPPRTDGRSEASKPAVRREALPRPGPREAGEPLALEVSKNTIIGTTLSDIKNMN